MAPKKRKNSPFVCFTIDEVKSIEANCYVIQVGVDLYDHGGQFIFDKRSANRHLKKILNGLVDVIQGKNKKQSEQAMWCLSTLAIMPVRIQ